MWWFFFRCDFGFEGTYCEQALGPLPTLVIEAMSSIASISTNFGTVQGASLAYHCGVVSSGRAVVFSKSGMRKLETVDVNTTHVRWTIMLKYIYIFFYIIYLLSGKHLWGKYNILLLLCDIVWAV